MTTTEAPGQQLIRIRAGELNAPLYRNNRGAWHDGARSIRYGLGNDSPQMDAIFKTGDLVGWTPLFITPAMIGRVVPVFTNIECKPPGWHLIPSDKRGHAQQTFIDMVLRHGGYAGFATSVEDYERIIGR